MIRVMTCVVIRRPSGYLEGSHDYDATDIQAFNR